MKKASIITPTTVNSKKYLQFVAKCVQHQDYKVILEWVIIDGTKEGESDLEITINKIKQMKKMPKIVFIPQDLTTHLLGNFYKSL